MNVLCVNCWWWWWSKYRYATASDRYSSIWCKHKPLIETHDLLTAERLWLSAQVTAMEKWSLLWWVQYRGLIGCKFGDNMICYECMGWWYDVVRNVFSKLSLIVVWNFRWWTVAQLLQTTPNSDLALASREMFSFPSTKMSEHLRPFQWHPARLAATYDQISL